MHAAVFSRLCYTCATQLNEYADGGGKGRVWDDGISGRWWKLRLKNNKVNVITTENSRLSNISAKEMPKDQRSATEDIFPKGQ